MSNPGLIKTRTASGAIAGRRLVAHGAADGLVVQAATAGAALCGVSERIDAAATEQVDVIMTGLAQVVYGAAVALGDPLTSDATGKAIPAAPGAGVTMRIIGYADLAGVAGDYGRVLIAPGILKG